VGGLNNEDALDEEDEGGGVEELGWSVGLVVTCAKWKRWWSYRMRREQDHIMAEDASPYDRCELCSSCVSCCILLHIHVASRCTYDPGAGLRYNSRAFIHRQPRRCDIMSA
jgi:hypothetical protein